MPVNRMKLGGKSEPLGAAAASNSETEGSSDIASSLVAMSSTASAGRRTSISHTLTLANDYLFYEVFGTLGWRNF